MGPPYRVDQIGSLMRPPQLIDAFASLSQSQAEDGAAPTGENGKWRSMVENAIREVVQKQLDMGVKTYTTGEFERAVFFDGFFESLTGFEKHTLAMEAFQPGLPNNKPLIDWGMKSRPALIATSKIKRERPAYLDDWLFFRSCLPKQEWQNAKMTMPSPNFWHMQLLEPFTAASSYNSDAEYLSDISAAMRSEILELYGAGLRNVQIDDPNLANFCSESWIAQLQQHGIDTQSMLDLHIKSHNDLLQDLPQDLNVGLHICRGNYPNGVFIVSGGYEAIAAKLFTESAYKLFYLEFDSPRAGDFTPLKHLSLQKAAVLGVVTTKSSDMEDITILKNRVLAAADVIAEANGVTREEALDCLAVSPQCGFSSAHSGAGVGMTVDVQWKKLGLLQQLAQELWPVRRVEV